MATFLLFAPFIVFAFSPNPTFDFFEVFSLKTPVFSDFPFHKFL